jgi:predicted aspartyl protease
MRPRLRLACLAMIACGCGPAAPAHVEAPPDSAAGEVGFEWAGTNDAALVVPVYIDGQGPYSFVLDTGATLTCVEQDVAAELSLREASGQIGFSAGIGGSGRIRLVSADSVRVGSATAEDLPLCALDLSSMERVGMELDGLLGLNFLRPFHISIDFEREVLTLRQP